MLKPLTIPQLDVQSHSLASIECPEAWKCLTSLPPALKCSYCGKRWPGTGNLGFVGKPVGIPERLFAPFDLAFRIQDYADYARRA